MVGEEDPPEEEGGEVVGRLPRELPELGDRRDQPDRGRKVRRWSRWGRRVGGDLPKHRGLWKPRRDRGLPYWPPTEIAELGWGEWAGRQRRKPGLPGNSSIVKRGCAMEGGVVVVESGE